MIIPLLWLKPNTPRGETPPFSVIVCANNELQNIKTLIPHLLSQEYPDYEVIIVLDRCKDGSIDYLKTLNDEKLRVIEIHELPKGFNGKKYGLTQAIEKAKHGWVLLTDADCIPASNQWVESMASRVTIETDLILGVSPYIDRSDCISQITNYETLQTAISYLSAALLHKAYMGVGRNIAYRKAKFHEVNGFHPFEEVTGGDDDLLVQKLSNRFNTQIAIDPNSLTHSNAERSWRSYLNQKTRHLSVGQFYKASVSLELSFNILVHAVLWLSFLYLLTTDGRTFWFGVIFVVWTGVKSLVYHSIASKLRIHFTTILYPLLDFFYAVFLPLIGLRASVVKHIKWR